MLKKNSVGALLLQATFIFAAVFVITLVVSAATSKEKKKPTDGLPKGNSLPPFVPREKRQIGKPNFSQPNFPPNDLTPFKQEDSSNQEKVTRHALGSTPADRLTTTTADAVTLEGSSTGTVIGRDAVTTVTDSTPSVRMVRSETRASLKTALVSWLQKLSLIEISLITAVVLLVVVLTTVSLGYALTSRRIDNLRRRVGGLTYSMQTVEQRLWNVAPLADDDRTAPRFQSQRGEKSKKSKTAKLVATPAASIIRSGKLSKDDIVRGASVPAYATISRRSDRAYQGDEINKFSSFGRDIPVYTSAVKNAIPAASVNSSGDSSGENEPLVERVESVAMIHSDDVGP